MALERMSPKVLELFGINPETEYHVKNNRMMLDNNFLGQLVKKKIPAREVASLLGENPYSSPFETALDILRQAAAKSSLGNSSDFAIPFEINEFTKFGRVLEPKIINWLRENGYPDIKNPSQYFGRPIKEDGFGAVFDFYNGSFSEPANPLFGGKWDARSQNTIFEIKTGTKRKWFQWKESGKHPQNYRRQAAIYAFLSGVDDVILASTYSTKEEREDPAAVALDASRVFVEQFKVSKEFPDIGQELQNVKGIVDDLKRGILPEFDTVNDFNYKSVAEKHFKDRVEKIKASGDLIDYPEGYKADNPALEEALRTKSFKESLDKVTVRDGAEDRRRVDISSIAIKSEEKIDAGKINQRYMSFVEKAYAAKDYFEDNMDTLTRIRPDTIIGILTQQSTGYSAMKGKSHTFSYREVPELSQFVDSLKDKSRRVVLARELWESESNQVLEKELEKVITNGLGNEILAEDISDSLKYFLKGSLTNITRTASNMTVEADSAEDYNFVFNTLEEELAEAEGIDKSNAVIQEAREDSAKLYARAAQSLDEEDFTKARSILDYLTAIAKKWQLNNSINSVEWENRHAELLSEYVDSLIFDPVKAQQDQIRRMHSVHNRIMNGLFSGRKLTVKDAYDIYNAGQQSDATPEAVARFNSLRAFFENNKPIVFTGNLSTQIDNGRSVQRVNVLDRLVDRYKVEYEKINGIVPDYSGADARIEQMNRARAAIGRPLINIFSSISENRKNIAQKNLTALGSLDIGLRINEDGTIYSTSDIEYGLRGAAKLLSKFFPLNLFKYKGIDYNYRTKAEEQLFKAGTKQVQLAYLLGQDDPYLKESILYRGGRLYRFISKENGSEEIALEEIAGTRNKFTTISTRVGMGNSFAQAALGREYRRDNSKKPETILDTIQRLADTEIEKLKDSYEMGNFTEIFGNFSREAVDFVRQDQGIIFAVQQNTPLSKDRQTESSIYHAFNTLAGVDNFANYIQANTEGFNKQSIEKLLLALEDFRIDRNDREVVASFERAREALVIAGRLHNAHHTKDMEDILARYIPQVNVAKHNFKSNSLSQTLSRFYRNDNAAKNRRNTKFDMEALVLKGQYDIMSFTKLLEKQFSTEAILNLLDTMNTGNRESFKGMQRLFRLFDEALPEKEAVKAKDLAVISKFLDITTLDAVSDGKNSRSTYLEERNAFFNKYIELAENTSEDARLVKSQFSNLFRAYFDSDGDVGVDARGKMKEFIEEKLLIQKGYGLRINPRFLIRQINQGHYAKAFDYSAKRIIDFSRQFIAGTDDLEHFSTYSLFMFERMKSLNDSLNKFDQIEFSGFGVRKTFHLGLGLGLHNTKDLASGAAIAKGLLMKRALPTYLLYNSIDFLDDVSKSVTGRGMYEAFASGAANEYLLLKKITGALGIDGGLKSLTSDNAILKHYASLSGEDNPEWNTYEEQKKYYESGYSPIRKAAFWTFGSSNEFRGGKISYFEPNTLRMLRSDFRKESLYNGEFRTKWSPMRLLDPYYMEKLHYEDRPYPVSGSYFSDSTPWGVMLNPIIGEAIKPKIRMHTDRLIGGMDVRTLIAKINRDIREKAEGENNLFIIKNGKLRSYEFMAFNHPTWDTDIYTFNDGEGESGGDYRKYTGQEIIDSGAGYHFFSADNNNIGEEETGPQSITSLSLKERMAIRAVSGDKLASLYVGLTGSPLNTIKGINEGIRKKAEYNKEEGMLSESKFIMSRGGIDDILENADEIADIINETSKNDYIKQMAISSRMIYGFYGYMASLVTGWGSNNYKRVATSADMTSTSRWFWDSGIGGFGGDVMEIVRRVIPEYRRFDSKNPLMNTMPEWMPERYRFGDPYSAVPVGEARMPGRGYESLNTLHPDIFGNYGAFDRFKILADIAPTSAEYKFWKKIASKTVKDPKLKEEMAEIRERVRAQTKQYEFEDYKYVGRGVEKQNAVVSEILSNGQFKIIGSDETYKLAGITIIPNEEETRQNVFQRYLMPGQQVQLITDENEYYGRNKDKARSISAAVITENGDNISEMMLQNKDARIRKSETSAAAVWGKHGGMVNGLNYLSELFMHADFPIIHNRWFRANDAIEEWKDEYVYGSAFQSWDDIIGSYVMPALRKGSESKFWMGLGIASDILYNTSDSNQLGSKHMLNLLNRFAGDTLNTNSFSRGKNIARQAIKMTNRLTDRFSLLGILTGGILHFGTENRTWMKQVPYRKAGVMMGLTYASLNNTNDLAVQLMASSRLGYSALDLLGEKSFAKKIKAAKIGAAIGALRWAGEMKLLASDDTANTFIPEKVRKKWKIEDYFDRLEYIKYEALFNKAADIALDKEGVDIKKILFTQSKEARDAIKTREDIKNYLKELRDNNSYAAKKVKFELFERLKALENKSSVPFTGGDYTKSAIMYYNAMKSTMYGLDETSSMADIIRALPKTDREFFMKFLEERDPARRKEILSIASPQIRKALNMLWYKKVEKPESNESYFSNHTLPAPIWTGWKPDIDLANVKAKVIENISGQLASDYGIYASQYRDVNVIKAPNINLADGGGDFISASLKLQAILNGVGLIGTEVSVEPQESNTLDVMVNLSKIIPYNINQSFKNVIH